MKLTAAKFSLKKTKTKTKQNLKCYSIFKYKKKKKKKKKKATWDSIQNWKSRQTTEIIFYSNLKEFFLFCADCLQMLNCITHFKSTKNILINVLWQGGYSFLRNFYHNEIKNWGTLSECEWIILYQWHFVFLFPLLKICKRILVIFRIAITELRGEKKKKKKKKNANS